MAERRVSLLRRTGMRKNLPAVVLVLPLLLAGCGDSGDAGGADAAPSASPSCAAPSAPGDARVQADLDGDGAIDTVDYVGPGGGKGCPPGLTAHVGGKRLFAPVTLETPVKDADVSLVQVQGRRGDLLLVKQTHPRGGFLAQLFGYADGSFETLTVDGKPIFDFIATDVPTTPTAVECAADGFTVTEARAHQPVGVMPAWDIYRTTYSVDGNTVTSGPTSKVADNVLGRQLQQDPSDLVDHPFFSTCRADR